MQEKDINTLITDYLWGNVSDDDIRQLRLYVDQSPEVKAKFDRLLDGKLLAERYRQYAAIGDYHPQRQRYSKFISQVGRWLPYAALLAAVVAISALLWKNRDQTQPPVISEQVRMAMQQGKEAERLQAEITIVGSPRQKQTVQQELQRFHVTDEVVSQLLEARRITTYQDKEYWLSLPDGTLVHLNYNTRLIYPEKFVGDTRDVVLQGGEAYFMVAQNRNHPFIVHTPQGDVKVFGTEFNVSTRANDGATEVVLVSGSLGVTPEGGQEQVIQPGQKCIITGTESQTSDVDVEPYVAWNEGKFSFQAWPLDKVMAVLARWYGYEKVEFAADSLRQRRLDGSFSRYDEVSNIMESIATVLDLDISFKDESIIIQ